MTQKEQRALMKGYVAQRLNAFAAAPDEACVRGYLAKLRRGIGKKPGDMPELWGLLFAGVPTELVRHSAEPTYAEWAMYTALTLYALHQQGHDFKRENMHRAFDSSLPDEDKRKYAGRLGRAVGRLVRSDEDRERVARRFNAFATASDMQEAAHYLRGLVQMLSAEGIPLDYVQLADDLFRFQFYDMAPSVRLNWGRDFYWYEAEEQKDEKEGQVADK